MKNANDFQIAKVQPERFAYNFNLALLTKMLLIKEVCFLKNSCSKNFSIDPVKGATPFSKCESRDCKTRSLSRRSIICCTRPHVFTLFARLRKKINWIELFFSLWRMMTSK